MKKNIILIAAAAACILASCNKMETDNTGKPTVEEATMILSIESQKTKASGSGHGSQAGDNKVNTLDVFIFRNNPGQPDDGLLDGYKRFSGADLGDMSALPVKATTGKKTVVAIANAHKENWNGVTSLNELKKQETLLKSENTQDFFMSGSKETTLEKVSEISISISRMVARVCLENISVDFTGTPYEGMSLSNVQIYLVNAIGNKYAVDGSDCTTKQILNKGEAVSSDIQGCTMSGILQESLKTAISNSQPYRTAHYFYCYENKIDTESASEKFTRLVVQGDIDGVTYYYPVNINQKDFGHSESVGHYGISRNTSYSLSLTINRPGSTDPDKPVVGGTLNVGITVEDWTTVPVSNIVF